MSDDSVTAAIMENLSSVVDDDGGISLPEQESEEPQDGAGEPARLVDPWEEGQQAAGEGDAPEEPAEPEEGAEAKPEEDEPAEPEAGTEEQPYTVDDFTDEEWMVVPVDGVPTKMKVKDAFAGLAKQATIDRRLHNLKRLQAETEKITEESTQRSQAIQRGAMETLGNKEKLMAHLTKFAPDVAIEFTLDMHEQLRSLIDKGHSLPSLIENAKLQRQRRELEAHRQGLQQRQRQEETSRAKAATQAQLRPILGEAAEAAGFTGKLSREVLSEIGAAWSVREKAKGQRLTPDELREIATKWLRVHSGTQEPATKERKPRRRRQPPKAVEAAPKPGSAPQGGGKRPSGPTRDAYGGISADWILSQS